MQLEYFSESLNLVEKTIGAVQQYLDIDSILSVRAKKKNDFVIYFSVTSKYYSWARFLDDLKPVFNIHCYDSTCHENINLNKIFLSYGIKPLRCN